jgi:hypothetical protein
MTAAEGHPYAGAVVALLTRHGKERVIAPVLADALGCQVRHVGDYDTDLLGTFTREVPRPGTQLAAARKKARIGMELTGLPCGMGSEGSFGPDPYLGLAPWNVELIVFIDAARALEVVGMAQGAANFAHLSTSEWTAVKDFAARVGFPEQQLVIRPEDESDVRIRKGIASWQALESIFAWACDESASGQVFVETDGRAHANPNRMANVSQATQDLVSKLGSLCPVCGMPGFWVVDRVAGLPCEGCGLPTREARAEISGCVKCDYRITQTITDREHAKAGHCDYCNP